MKIFFILLFFTVSVAYSQKYNPQDCRDAIPVCRPFYDCQNSYIGDGDVPQEINNNSSCLRTGEVNSVWYVVNVKSSGNLGFLITPYDSTNDYDWAVYNLTRSKCSDIYIDPTLEVSCNYSEAKLHPEYNGLTGAAGDTTYDKGDVDSLPINNVIPVKAGETYIIMISNYSSTNQKGYKLDFSLSTASIYDDIPPRLASLTIPSCGSNEVWVRFSENIDCSSISFSDFSFSGPVGTYAVTAITSSNCLNGGIYSRDFGLNITPKPVAPGIYKLKLTGDIRDACNNTNITRDSVTYELKGLESVLSANRSTICPNDTTRLSIQPKGTAPFKYSWSNPSLLSCTDCNNPIANVQQTTVFTVSFTDAFGCMGIDSIVVNTLPLAKITSITSDTVICSSSSFQLNVTTDGSTKTNFKWSPSTGLNRTDIPNPVVSLDTNITYTVTMTNPDNGCSETRSIKISINKPFSPSIKFNGFTDSTTICEGDFVLLDAGTQDDITKTKYDTYQWYKDGVLLKDSVTQFLHAIQTGQYSVLIKSELGCFAADTFKLRIDPLPKIQIETDTVLCFGSQLNLNAKVNFSQGNLSFKWLDNTDFIDPDNIPNPRVIPKQIKTYRYIVEAKDLINGCIGRDTVSVRVVPNVDFDLGDDRNFCLGQPVTLKAIIKSGTAPFHYKWSPINDLSIPSYLDSTTAVVSPQTSRKYYFYVFDSNGCSSVDSVSIKTLSPYIEFKLPEVTEDPRNRSVKLPIIVTKNSDFFDCFPDSIKVEFNWEATLFNPQSAEFNGYSIPFFKQYDKTQKSWLFKVSIPNSYLKKTDNDTCNIIGDVMLGDKDSIPLIIQNIDFSGVIIPNKSVFGFLRTRYMEDGSHRYIKNTSALVLKSITPNPADKEFKVEFDYTCNGFPIIINVYDLLGNVIFNNLESGKTIKNDNDEYQIENKSLIIPSYNLKSGLYKVRLCSGINCDAMELIIIQ